MQFPAPMKPQAPPMALQQHSQWSHWSFFFLRSWLFARFCSTR